MMSLGKDECQKRCQLMFYDTVSSLDNFRDEVTRNLQHPEHISCKKSLQWYTIVPLQNEAPCVWVTRIQSDLQVGQKKKQQYHHPNARAITASMHCKILFPQIYVSCNSIKQVSCFILWCCSAFPQCWAVRNSPLML
jgi:hypothetical protein